LSAENWRALASVLTAQAKPPPAPGAAAASSHYSAAGMRADHSRTAAERARRLLVRLGQLLRRKQGDASPRPAPSARDLAALAVELVRGRHAERARLREVMPVVRRVILGLQQNATARDGAVGALAQIGKDLIRHGQVELGRGLVWALFKVWLRVEGTGFAGYGFGFSFSVWLGRGLVWALFEVCRAAGAALPASAAVCWLVDAFACVCVCVCVCV